ncbi:MAG: hypothetical protein EP330_26315 [Deltaproteobacteria bacterium]|nr:MAG: hypothetical protein EP330_26315 [Deltaproteobacteria bacterium]
MARQHRHAQDQQASRPSPASAQGLDAQASLGNAFLAETLASSAGAMGLDAGTEHGLACNCQTCADPLALAQRAAEEHAEAEDAEAKSEALAEVDASAASEDDADDAVLQAVVPGTGPEFPKSLGRTDPDTAALAATIPHIGFKPASQQPTTGVAIQLQTGPVGPEPTHPAWATPAGDTVSGKQEVKHGGETLQYDVIVRVSADMHAQIVAAEDEHLADLHRAYQLVVGQAGRILGAQANTVFTAPTANEAVAKVENQLEADALAAGFNEFYALPEFWLDGLIALAECTRERDHKLWHSFDYDAAEFDHDNQQVVLVVNAGRTEIGKHSSAKIVDWNLA